MIRSNFFSKLNYRLILLHVLASWCFICAFHIYANLHSVKWIDMLRHYGAEITMGAMKKSDITAGEVVDLLLWQALSGFVGLFVAFLISLLIVLKKRWFWVNSILVLLISFCLYKYTSIGWPYVRKLFEYPGEQFNSSTMEFSVNGSILLTIGLLIFFLPKINRFIAKNNSSTVLEH